MVINPQILATAQIPAATPVAAEPTSPASSGASPASLANLTPQQEIAEGDLTDKKLDELQRVREANKKKDSEIATLRKEIEWMKQELRERSATTETVSKRLPPKRKSAEAYPSR